MNIDPEQYRFEDLLYRSIKLIEKHIESHDNKLPDPEFKIEGKQLIGEWKALNSNIRYKEQKEKKNSFP